MSKRRSGKRTNTKDYKKNSNNNGKVENKQSKNILLSVIIPSYNVEQFVHKCLDSVLSQNIDNMEIICVDDCSSDCTLQILNEYKNKDSRIQVIANKENKGAGACRNQGIQLAKGEYIHFLDADDWLEDNAYGKAINTLKEANAEMCVFWYNKFDNITQNSREVRLFQFETGKVVNKKNNCNYFFFTSVVPWNKVFRRDFIVNNQLKFDEIVCANDRTFYFTAVSKAERIVFHKEALINYRVNNPLSLVGQARKKHYDCHFYSYYSTKNNIFSLLDEFQRKTYIVSALEDILCFFRQLNDAESLNKLKDFLSDIREDIELVQDELILRPFGAEFLLLMEYLDIKDENYIPVVFATNDNYAPYMSVAIQSLISHSQSHNNYRVYVLHSGVNREHIEKIEGLSTNNVLVKFIDVSAKIQNESNSLYSRAHYSKEMYYRILIPELFRKFHKVVYLDCDIVLNRDVADLFSVNIGNNCLGGVVNISSEEMSRYIKNMLKLPVEEYINSGILVINCDAFNENKIKEKCFELLKGNQKYVCPDQDILNISCNKKIQYLDLKWNFQWYYCISNDKEKKKINLSTKFVEKYLVAQDNPFVIHYTSGIKAWNSPERQFAYDFWKYAQSNPLILEIICKNIGKIIEFSVNNPRIAELENKNHLLNEKLSWNREEVKRLKEEKESLLKVITLEALNNSRIKNDEGVEKVIFERNDLAYQISEIRKSFSYRIGLFLTFVPRKIREVLS